MKPSKHLKPADDRFNVGKRVLPPPVEKTDWNLDCPAFCLKFIKREFAIEGCDMEQRASFASMIGKLSQISWNQIYSAPRHGLGCEKIPQHELSGIPQHITPDVQLIAFRFWNNAPMVGYRSGRIFHIIWIDPKRKAYPH